MNSLSEKFHRYRPTFAAFASLRLCSGHALREINPIPEKSILAQRRKDAKVEKDQIRSTKSESGPADRNNFK
jgi:hypothetical protein